MMRWPVSLSVALVFSCLLFLFIQSLIRQDQVRDIMDQVVTQLSFVEPPPPPEPEPPQVREEVQETPVEQPQMSELASALPTPTAPALSPTADLSVPNADWAPSLNLPAGGNRWAGQVGGLSLNTGEEGKGYIEVAPLATRRPNIPEMAWQNKINGWVLVAFTLKPDGHTKNIRVLDAHPRGIFEEDVIRAIRGWLYDIKSLGTKGDIVLTQKIELFWKDYPENSPYPENSLRP